MEKKTENKEKKEKSEKSSFWKSRKFIAVVIISLALIAAILFGYFMPAEQTVLMERLNYSFQIVTNIFVICGGIIAVWQYYISSQSAKMDLKIQQVQRAIDLSEYYKNNILRYTIAIKYVFDECGCGEIIKKIPLSENLVFNYDEMTKYLTKEDMNALQKCQSTKEFLDSVLTANIVYDLNFSFDIPEKYKIVSTENKELKPEEYLLSLADSHMASLCADVLNNMEFFALHFRHGTADETVVYQSLHQSYLEIMPYLYCYISKINTNPTKKFFTNLIYLYSKWQQRSSASEAELKKINESYTQNINTVSTHGTIIEDKY